MDQKTRHVVIPSECLGDATNLKAGRGTYIDAGKIYSEHLGILNQQGNVLQVLPLKGRYNPIPGDFIIGIVIEAMQSSWLVDINAPYPAVLHVNEAPWEVEFGDTARYLNAGDSVLAKVLSVDESKKLQVTLKDRNLYKIKGGNIIEVDPSIVPRIIGKKGSMIANIKKYSRSRIFVGQNGRIWIDGPVDGIELVLLAINKIESEAITFGLTDRVEALLKEHAKDVR
jgi:exosome complex component RRP4